MFFVFLGHLSCSRQNLGWLFRETEQLLSKELIVVVLCVKRSPPFLKCGITDPRTAARNFGLSPCVRCFCPFELLRLLGSRCSLLFLQRQFIILDYLLAGKLYERFVTRHLLSDALAVSRFKSSLVFLALFACYCLISLKLLTGLASRVEWFVLLPFLRLFTLN